MLSDEQIKNLCNAVNKRAGVGTSLSLVRVLGELGILPDAATLRERGLLPEEEPQCEYCMSEGSERCYSRFGNYGCTRAQGHEGDHVACGNSVHELYRWSQEAPLPPCPFCHQNMTGEPCNGEYVALWDDHHADCLLRGHGFNEPDWRRLCERCEKGDE